MKKEVLEVVNERGEVLYEATRSEIHSKGLLHKEIHVWLYTPDGKLVFQHRSKMKDTFPDKLDASVGGHVDIGESYEKAALRECKEELGIEIEKMDDLIFLMTTITNSYDKITHKINHARRNTYAYCYRKEINDLSVESEESQGFVLCDIKSLSALSENEKEKFVPTLISDEYLPIYKKIISLL